MSNIHTNFAMRALPVASASGVVGGMRDGHVFIRLLPVSKRSHDIGTAGIAIT